MARKEKTRERGSVVEVHERDERGRPLAWSERNTDGELSDVRIDHDEHGNEREIVEER